MKSLIWKGIIQAIAGLIFFVTLIYFSAGTWDYWQGWVFLAVFAVSTNAFGIYLELIAGFANGPNLL